MAKSKSQAKREKVMKESKKPTKASKAPKYSAVYEDFLATLSSNEQEAYRAEPVRATYAFRKYVGDMSDKDFMSKIAQ